MNPEENKISLFISSIKRIKESRVHKINNSLGVYDSYKWIRKNKWLDINKNLSEHEFYSIIRRVNDYLAEELINGNSISLPHRMGELELRKYESSMRIINDKLVTNLPIDWDRTLKLWYEDLDAYNKRTLIKMEENEIFKIYYNKIHAEYNNKSFYLFKVNREIKLRLKYNIKRGRIDAFKFK